MAGSWPTGTRSSPRTESKPKPPAKRRADILDACVYTIVVTIMGRKRASSAIHDQVRERIEEMLTQMEGRFHAD